MPLKNSTAYIASMESPIGPIHIACSKKHVLQLQLGHATNHELIHGWISRDYSISHSQVPLVQKAIHELGGYFSKKRKKFTIKPAFEGTPFQSTIWKMLYTIPYGHVITYGELARLAGHPNAARAVGSAMACNPVPLIVPCHRVITSNRKLGGFTGGTHIKETLLTLENVTNLTK